MSKNILILMSSPRKSGNTSTVCKAFAKGAKESGHVVVQFNAGDLKIHPCLGCDYCGSHQGKCCQPDDMRDIYEAFERCDVIVLASPLYFYSISAQLKTMIDRLYAPGLYSQFKYGQKESVLIMTCAESSDDIFDQPKQYYNTLLKRIFPWKHRGEILVKGLGTIEGNPALDEAYTLGKNI